MKTRRKRAPTGAMSNFVSSARARVLPKLTPSCVYFGGRVLRRREWKRWKSQGFYIMAKRQLTPEFREFLACLNRTGVEYLLAGGFAVLLGGYLQHLRTDRSEEHTT